MLNEQLDCFLRYLYFQLFNPKHLHLLLISYYKKQPSVLTLRAMMAHKMYTATHKIYKREKNLTKVSQDMSYCVFEEPANTWVTSPRITIKLTFCIHGGRRRWWWSGDQSGSFCSDGCFYEQENPVTQFPPSRMYLATLRHGRRRGMSWNVYCCFKRCHRTDFVSIFHVVLRGRVVFLHVCQMHIKNKLAHYV